MISVAPTLKAVLSESTLSRVWQIATRKDRPFAIITAFRHEYSPKENLERNKRLASDLRNLGYGFWVLDGHWVEQGDDGSKHDSKEDSFFVSRSGHHPDFVASLERLRDKYQQEAIVVKGEDNIIKVLFKDGEPLTFGRVSPNKVAQAYNSLRRDGRTFVFESAGGAGGLASAYVRQAIAGD